jgi:hypothetical protein
MHWPEITQELYESVRADVQWETDVPQGAKFHVAWFADDGFHVLDLWESQSDFEQFAGARLAPSTARIGIKSAPQVTFSPAHAIFTPNV